MSVRYRSYAKPSQRPSPPSRDALKLPAYQQLTACLGRLTISPAEDGLAVRAEASSENLKRGVLSFTV